MRFTKAVLAGLVLAATLFAPAAAWIGFKRTYVATWTTRKFVMALLMGLTPTPQNSHLVEKARMLAEGTLAILTRHLSRGHDSFPFLGCAVCLGRRVEVRND